MAKLRTDGWKLTLPQLQMAVTTVITKMTGNTNFPSPNPPLTTLLSGLVSGTRVWVKVRVIGSQGPGPWSDPATKIVP